jgi:hypothetical protein
MRKKIAIVLVLALITNLTLFTIGLIQPLVFWGVLAIIAAVSWKYFRTQR